ncbi:MAG: orotate phosphoribosyltransferase [Bacteroidota bacterium]
MNIFALMTSSKESGLGMTIAAKLLDIGAIKLSVEKPFTWSSGWKSPIYCDNRLSLSYPELRTLIKTALSQAIRKEFPEAEAIAGVATAGIPQGALVADEMGLPFLYVRSKPKGHGMENLIEGKIDLDQKVVVVEDLISTGGSSLKAAAALQKAEAKVLGMAAIFTYGFDLASENFKAAEIPIFCLSNYEYLIKVALEREYIKEDQQETLRSWRADPAAWG